MSRQNIKNRKYNKNSRYKKTSVVCSVDPRPFNYNKIQIWISSYHNWQDVSRYLTLALLVTFPSNHLRRPTSLRALTHNANFLRRSSFRNLKRKHCAAESAIALFHVHSERSSYRLLYRRSSKKRIPLVCHVEELADMRARAIERFAGESAYFSYIFSVADENRKEERKKEGERGRN